jgi:crossover junction endodeoxyribonuclease RuvC
LCAATTDVSAKQICEKCKAPHLEQSVANLNQLQNNAAIKDCNHKFPFQMFLFRANAYKTIIRAVMRVIGIDPGLRNMGWGIVDVAGSKLSHVANGVCKTLGTDALATRLHSLHTQLSEVIEAYGPDAASVEQTFVNKSGTATLKLGQARAICLLVPAQFGLSVSEYAPNAVKKTVVGVGHAEKEQVVHMVRLQLPGVKIANADAADALAIALCHAHQSRFSGKLAAAVARAGGAA